jgi:hypothetical protein
MTDAGGASRIDELIELVREAALQKGFYWVGPGHAYAGNEPRRPAYWRVYSDLGWLGGPHVYAEVDDATSKILLLEERGWETPGARA